MTDAQRPPEETPQHRGSFGDAAAEMANETEVESDISGVDNWLEEGGPVESKAFVNTASRRRR